MERSLVRFLAPIAWWFALVAASPGAFAVDSGSILVERVKGEVHVTMSGAARAVRAGSVLELPATVRTGRDGSIDLRQGATTVSVGPDTLLEFPALEKPGAPIDHIVQPRGNAFYDIGKRAGRKLRVETPYLVGVVKGTQFNVAALDEATTISLFEGFLELRAADDSDVVDLKAGEIASRRRGDKTISVIKMDGGKAPPTQRAPPGSGGGDNSSSPGTTPSRPGADLDDSVVVGGNVSTPVLVPGGSVGVGVSADVATNANVDLGAGSIDAGAAAAVDVADSVGVDAGVAAGVDVGAGSASVDLGADVAGVDTSLAAGVDAGSGTVDLGVSLGGAELDVGLDLGLGSEDTDPSAPVDTATDPAPTPATPVIDVPDLLDGLILLPGRK